MGESSGILYIPYSDIITRIKQNVMNVNEYERVVDRYENANILLTDDLFKRSVSKSDVNIVFEIVNFRYLNNLYMIIRVEKDVILGVG
ncbi:DNA replication protein DnaC,hypothetical protein,DNA replication protein [[Clostridium] sordellii]|nr:DNA replication protein DnaC,hypothetical protein,DNA replication protein [[Clostridium] sordellii] [Paeniclostridium sordellii]